jgi:flavin-dependent thymidylate synthase
MKREKKMGTDVQKWADKAMFTAAPISVQEGPQVVLLSCNSDPLGTIVAAAKMYKGEYVESLSEVTDEERRFYLEDTRKNVLAAPLEFVNFHFLISGVTRGFTHQMVRQRTATYTQESTRFAVKEDVPVSLPQCLANTKSWDEWVDECWKKLYPDGGGTLGEVTAWAMKQAGKEQMWRYKWDYTVGQIEQQYKELINTGMPAEDARGLLPTNLLTRINYNTSLRGLLEHSGLRLCTQAQFEWRLVWTKIKEAIVEYGKTQTYAWPGYRSDFDAKQKSSTWQFEALADIFKPICYQKGSCQFQSSIDRACTIRDRVQNFADLGIPSTDWGKYKGETLGIRDEEWMLDESAARVSQ